MSREEIQTAVYDWAMEIFHCALRHSDWQIHQQDGSKLPFGHIRLRQNS